MKVLITYSSKTGNTEKVCRYVYEKLKEKVDIALETVKETKDVEAYDLIVVGFWVDKGTANREAKKFIEKIKDKKIAFLATLGAAPDGDHGKKVIKNANTLVNATSEYLGISLARGKVDPKLTKNIKFLPLPSKIKDQMYESSINSREPNQKELDQAVAFVEQALEK